MMDYKRLKYVLTAVLVSLAIGTYAQETEEQQEPEQASSTQSEAAQDTPSSLAESIDIVRTYRPILARAIKVRQSPDMDFDRQGIELKLRKMAADIYFSLYRYKQAYYGVVLERNPQASQDNIDNYRIGYLAYGAKEYERASGFMKQMQPTDAFYQSSVMTLGHIALENGDKQAAREAFAQAAEMDLDPQLKWDALYNYAKILFELDSTNQALDLLQNYMLHKYGDREPGAITAESEESLSVDVFLGTSNFHAGVSLLEKIKNRTKQADTLYQQVTYYRGLEFYNERAFENSISAFMRSEKYPFDKEMAALATYWKAEAMYEVRKYGEAVESFSSFLSIPNAENTRQYPYANYGLAYAAFRDNSYGLAAKYFERFFELEASSMEDSVRNDVTARLGDSYLSLRNYERATQYYNQLIESKASNQDYALFQLGILHGLQGDDETKRSILQSLVEEFPSSNYADDVAFEIPYTYFIGGEEEKAIEGLEQMMEDYPRSSYVPRALITIGLVHYNKGDNQAAKETFEKVIEEHATTNEAQQALKAIENIYLDEGDATGYINYASNIELEELSPAQQDNLVFQTANSLFTRGAYGPAVEAINAYFDKFPRPRQEKHARYIRGVSLYHTGHPREALQDLNLILNDWTSEYTENTLLTTAALYLEIEEYNEAIVHLKKLELTSDYKDQYGYAIRNLMICYYELGDQEQMERYAKQILDYPQSTDEEIATVHLYRARMLMQDEQEQKAIEALDSAVALSQQEVGAEARYRLGRLQYADKQYDKALETAFDVINNMSAYDYWVAKSFILLADAYAGKGEKAQAKSTLESIIENYEGDDDVIPSAKESLQRLSGK